MNENLIDDQIRVLVIEDNPFDQELLRRELRNTNFGNRIRFISDPVIALDMLQGPESPLNLELLAIFLDIHLPRMSGLDFLKLVRSIPGLERLPIIVMTSSPSPETIRQCKQLQVRALVEKPVRLSKFATALADIFHSSPAHNEDPRKVNFRTIFK